MTPGPTLTAAEQYLLRRAIELAATARALGDEPFGSILVGPEGDVLAEEQNTIFRDNDITAHPELKLARWAGRMLDPAAAASTTIYTSCEPCAMCRAVIAQARIGRVVFALSVAELACLYPAGVRSVPQQHGPFLLDEARLPVEGYRS